MEDSVGKSSFDTPRRRRGVSKAAWCIEGRKSLKVTIPIKKIRFNPKEKIMSYERIKSRIAVGFRTIAIPQLCGETRGGINEVPRFGFKDEAVGFETLANGVVFVLLAGVVALVNVAAPIGVGGV